MSRDRFIRQYELVITLTSGEVISIVPEIRIQFEANKSIKGGLNTCTIKIYNLAQDKHKKLVREKELSVGSKVKPMPFLLKAGYNKLETIFKGSIVEAKTLRTGSDFITTIFSQDGEFDFVRSFTSKTVKNNEINNILDDMPNTKKGKISKRQELIRPKVLVGNSAKLIEENLAEDETYYIDDEKLYIIKDDEVTSSYIPLVQANTGLLNTPTRANSEVTFSTLLNPEIRIGGLVAINSKYAEYLNGIFKVKTIKYKGDNYGSDWSQECVCTIAQDYKVI